MLRSSCGIQKHLYRLGQCSYVVPPVCTAFWDDTAWMNAAKFWWAVDDFGNWFRVEFDGEKHVPGL